MMKEMNKMKKELHYDWINNPKVIPLHETLLDKHEEGWITKKLFECTHLNPDGSCTDYMEGQVWETVGDYLALEVCNFCSCGDPVSVLFYIRDMLLRHCKHPETDDISCWQVTQYEDLDVMFFLYWADHKGFTEHGTTIRCSWIDEKGIALLKSLQLALEEYEKEGRDE